jgi:hypothetical protein
MCESNVEMNKRDIFDVVNEIAQKRSKEIGVSYRKRLPKNELIQIGFVYGMIETFYLYSKVQQGVKK